MDSDHCPTTAKTTGKLRFILNSETEGETETSSNSASAKPKKNGNVRFNLNPEETSSTSKSSERPVVPRTVKKTQRYNKKREFDIHIHRLLKITSPDITISRDAIDVLNTFTMDIMERISKAASDLVKYNKTSTLGLKEIKSASKLVLPQELASFGIIDANKAWKKYTDSKIIAAPASEDQMCHWVCP